MKKLNNLLLVTLISGHIAAADKPKEKPEEQKYQPLTLKESAAKQIAQDIIKQFKLEKPNEADLKGALQKINALATPIETKNYIYDFLEPTIVQLIIKKFNLDDIKQVENVNLVQVAEYIKKLNISKFAQFIIASEIIKNSDLENKLQEYKDETSKRYNLKLKIFNFIQSFISYFSINQVAQLLNLIDIEDIIDQRLLRPKALNPQSKEADILREYYRLNPESLIEKIFFAIQSLIITNDPSRLSKLLSVFDIKKLPREQLIAEATTQIRYLTTPEMQNKFKEAIKKYLNITLENNNNAGEEE